MTDDVVGQVAELWRFPVKSFQGEAMDSVEVTATGVGGDRVFALRDVATSKILSAKRHGVLLSAFARTTDEGIVMTLPDGSEHTPGEPGIDDVLSDWLDFPVRLDKAAADHGNGVYEFAFDIEDSPDAEWFDIDIPVGSYVDLAGAHLLTTASLAEISQTYPDGVWDTRRFRPTALIDTGTANGFVEDAWIGGIVTLGSASVAVEMPTIRCVMPSRVQPALGGSAALDRDKKISRTISDQHGSNLGVYCAIASPGRIALGDDVTVTR